MSTVTVNPPKTPVTEKSNDVAPASVPNICKMPGPPAPFVPAPLPNIGQSSDNLSDCTTTVKIEGAKVAIKGSYYMSKGDIASKGTGGGMVSAATHGKTEFIAPGSMDVKAQGKNIQLLGDAMTNNGNMANAASTNVQPPLTPAQLQDIVKKCTDSCEDSVNKKHFPNNKTHGNKPTAAQCKANLPGTNQNAAKALGDEKHKCASECAAAAIPPGQRDQVSIGQPYSGAGSSLQTAGPPGGIPPAGGGAPDFVLHGAGTPTQGITAVFDMKFPCPRGTNIARWGQRLGVNQGELYALMFRVVPRLISPFARVFSAGAGAVLGT